MKIRGNTVGTTIRPKSVLVKCGDLTKEEQAQVRENLGVSGDASINDNAVSTSATWSSEKINRELAKLSYKPIEIVKFTANGSTVEVGSTANITLTWELNRYPTILKLTDISNKEVELELAKNGSYKLPPISTPANYPKNKTFTWKLHAWDEENVYVYNQLFVSFGNNIYYGAAEEPEAYTPEFIKGLEKKVLVSSRQYNFTVNADDAGEYIYFCVPANYGDCKFTVNGFTGGFAKVADAVSLTNGSGYTENYYVYRSDNAGLGEQKVTVT